MNKSNVSKSTTIKFMKIMVELIPLLHLNKFKDKNEVEKELHKLFVFF